MSTPYVLEKFTIYNKYAKIKYWKRLILSVYNIKTVIDILHLKKKNTLWACIQHRDGRYAYK